MTSPVVSVAIVSWNTAAHLDRCLTALAADAAAGRAEVWVVDNASADGSPEVARRHGFARVIALNENVGFARALDLVASRSQSAWIACANADVEVSEHALERLLAAGEARDRVGAVAPRLLLPDGSTQHSAHMLPTLRGHALFQSGLVRLAPQLGERLALGGYWDADRPRFVDWAVGAFLLVRREALDAAGGFGADPRLYAEDVDLGWRLRRAGWRTWYEPSAVVRHDESAATRRAWGERRHELRIAATYGWHARREGPARACALAALNVSGEAVRAAAGLARRDPRWKDRAGLARLHAVGIVRGLRDRRGHGP